MLSPFTPHHKHRHRPVRIWLKLALFLLLPLLLLDLWASHSLFRYVSYTNSRNMDPQIAYFEARQDWDYVAIGSSETKWGIVPSQIDLALRQKGVQAAGFNLGLDGFNSSYYKAILPFLNLPKRLPNMRVALIGINLIEELQTLPNSFDQQLPCEGLLQRAILKSAFAKDYGLSPLCTDQTWPAPLVNAIEKVSATVRYRQALRTLLMGYDASGDLINTASNGLTQYPNGFYAHKSIQENQKEAAIDYQNFLNQKQTEPNLFVPMERSLWPTLLIAGGFFDQWVSDLAGNNILPVFFALPTNPVMIDARHRRDDYQRNSQMMTEWAMNEKATTHRSFHPRLFIDLGIKDSYDPTRDYADYRHLSEQGATRFSRELGEQIARQQQVISALRAQSVVRPFSRRNAMILK